MGVQRVARISGLATVFGANWPLDEREQCTLTEGRCIINPTSADLAVHRPLLPVFAHFEWPVGSGADSQFGREYIDFSAVDEIPRLPGGFPNWQGAFILHSPLPSRPFIDCIENFSRDSVSPDRSDLLD